MLKTPSHSQLVLMVLTEIFSFPRWRSLFKTAQFEHVSHQDPGVEILERYRLVLTTVVEVDTRLRCVNGNRSAVVTISDRVRFAL